MALSQSAAIQHQVASPTAGTPPCAHNCRVSDMSCQDYSLPYTLVTAGIQNRWPSGHACSPLQLCCHGLAHSPVRGVEAPSRQELFSSVMASPVDMPLAGGSAPQSLLHLVPRCLGPQPHQGAPCSPALRAGNPLQPRCRHYPKPNPTSLISSHCTNKNKLIFLKKITIHINCQTQKQLELCQAHA